MAVYIEDYIPVVQYQGLNTKKAVDMSGSSSVALSTTSVTTGPVAVTGSLTTTTSVAATTSVSAGTIGVLLSTSTTPTTAGGTQFLRVGTAAANIFGFYLSNVATTPTASAPQGSVCFSTAGASTGTRMWINTDGATSWTGVTTAA